MVYQPSLHLPRCRALRLRHNERYGVPNQRRLDGLLNRLSKRRSKKTSKLRGTGFCEGNSSVTGEFPSQRTSIAENVSFQSRYHDNASLQSYVNDFSNTNVANMKNVYTTNIRSGEMVPDGMLISWNSNYMQFVIDITGPLLTHKHPIASLRAMYKHLFVCWNIYHWIFNR